jgi:hypothetical protein
MLSPNDKQDFATGCFSLVVISTVIALTLAGIVKIFEILF